jgi:hypothetical protein
VWLRIEKHVLEIKEFQKISAESFQAQVQWRDDILKGLEAIKATTKPRNRWYYAMQDFNKIKEVLNPLQATSGPLADALDQNHDGTCE